MSTPTLSFDHLLSLSDEIGTFEHAEHTVPRPEHGYCTDDMARVLVVVAREPRPSRSVSQLGRTAFRFLADAQGATGRVRNRRDRRGRWTDRRSVEDSWGRTIWAFGTAVHRAPELWMRQSALSMFDHAVQQRSRWPRTMTFAALGAAEVLAVEPHHRGALALLADAIDAIGPLGREPGWPWPEPRLSYANAAVAEAIIVAGSLLHRPRVEADGLTLLGWLLDRETVDGHLSPTPVGGAGPEDHAPSFDQQPIEVAAMADACARATAVTGDPGWLRGVELAVAWFDGDNDVGAPMWDPIACGGFDGLHADGPNLNQGAESTLAMLSTIQQARRLTATGS